MDGVWLLFVYIQFNQSKSKPIQPRNSNLNYIQFLDLKTKRRKTKNKNNNFTGGGKFSSLPSPHSVRSLFTVLPRFWVCKIVFWSFLISSPLSTSASFSVYSSPRSTSSPLYFFFLFFSFFDLDRLSISNSLSWCTSKFNRLIFLFIIRGF